MLCLDTHEIHLWCAFPAEIGAKNLDEKYRLLLSSAELEQKSRFLFERDQRRYLTTRVLVRSVLSRYVPIPPHKWVFAKNAYGRPHITNEGDAIKNISFNITHSNNLVVLAVAHSCAIGVDTENIRLREVAIDLSDRFFAPEEAGALRNLPKPNQQQRFFEYWTLKESYIKARGMGLSIPLDRFSFRFPCDEIEFSVHPDLQDSSSRWQFWQLLLSEENLVALCVERVRKNAPKLIVKTICPLVSESEIQFTILRASASPNYWM